MTLKEEIVEHSACALHSVETIAAILESRGKYLTRTNQLKYILVVGMAMSIKSALEHLHSMASDLPFDKGTGDIHGEF